MEHQNPTLKRFVASAGNYLAYVSSGMAFGSALYLVFAAEMINKYVSGYNQKPLPNSDFGAELMMWGLLIPVFTSLPCLVLARRKPIFGAGSVLCIGLSTIVVVMSFISVAILFTMKAFSGYC